MSRGIMERRGSQDITITKYEKVRGRNVEVNTKSAAAMETKHVDTPSANVAFDLTQALKKVQNCYAQVDFSGGSGGHATAAWIGGAAGRKGDACYYDPNFGEVWFADKEKFFEWFRYFYQNSYQGFPCGFNSSWTVRQRGLSNTAGKGAYAKAVLSVAGAR
jgi:hypothetical protein